MAKDRNGKPIAIGDKVTITGIVSMVWGSSDQAEVLIEPLEKSLAGSKMQIPLNSKQIEAVPPPPKPQPAAAAASAAPVTAPIPPKG